MDEFTNDDYRAFDALPLRHKLALSKEPHPGLASVVHIADWTVDGKLMHERSLRHFDVAWWLDGE